MALDGAGLGKRAQRGAPIPTARVAVGWRNATFGPGLLMAAPNKYVLIWDVVRRIPRGRVASYGQVADLAGLNGHARLAGYALHASTAGALPWHRVVNSEGRLSLARTDVSSAVTQRMRLEQEGVRFDARGRVDMARFRWEPSKPIWEGRSRPNRRARR